MTVEKSAGAGEVVSVEVSVPLDRLADAAEPVPSWAASELLRLADQAREEHRRRAATDREEPVGREVVSVTVTVRQAYRAALEEADGGSDGVTGAGDRP